MDPVEAFIVKDIGHDGDHDTSQRHHCCRQPLVDIIVHSDFQRYQKACRATELKRSAQHKHGQNAFSESSSSLNWLALFGKIGLEQDYRSVVPFASLANLRSDYEEEANCQGRYAE